jgi:hypothetical protein
MAVLQLQVQEGQELVLMVLVMLPGSPGKSISRPLLDIPQPFLQAELEELVGRGDSNLTKRNKIVFYEKIRCFWKLTWLARN